MALLGVTCRARILNQFVDTLSKYVETCKASPPSWEASFDQGIFSEAMANNIVNKRLSKVVSSHNSVHQTLSAMNQAATFLDVTPKLQENELTAAAVSVAFSTLARATAASVFIIGVTNLDNFRCDADGHQKAQAFLKKHASEKEAIPAAFGASLRTSLRMPRPLCQRRPPQSERRHHRRQRQLLGRSRRKGRRAARPPSLQRRRHDVALRPGGLA